MNSIIPGILLFLLPYLGLGQTCNDKCVVKTFGAYEYRQPAKRRIMDLKHLKFYQKLNPLLYVSAGSMFVYQRIISPQMGTNCQFELSCSSNAKKAVEEKGIFKGSLLGAYQWISCSGSPEKDYSSFRMNPHTRKVRTFQP